MKREKLNRELTELERTRAEELYDWNALDTDSIDMDLEEGYLSIRKGADCEDWLVYMDAADNVAIRVSDGDMVGTEEDAERFWNLFGGVRIETAYAPDTDMTFVLEYRDTPEGMTLSVIGWYAGEPDEDMTAQAKEMGLVGVYPGLTVSGLFG